MLTLDFINVGYGDAILIRDGAISALVDCGDWTVGDGGPGSARISAADFLRREGVQTLDLLVLTHLHRDHSGGLAEVLKAAQVRTFWTNYLPPRTAWGRELPISGSYSAGGRCLLESLNIYLAALQAMDLAGTSIREICTSCADLALTPSLRASVSAGEDALLRRQAEIWQHVLDGRADRALLDELDQFINDTSLRLTVCGSGIRAELPGDVSAACWEAHAPAPCTILKLPHHGHKDSITPGLLRMLSPTHAVISVSNTRTDDCPSAAVLQALARQGCTIHCTDAVHSPLCFAPPHASVHFSFGASEGNG